MRNRTRRLALVLAVLAATAGIVAPATASSSDSSTTVVARGPLACC